MTLNSTPSAERIHIGIFGKRNAGKSSLINALTTQNIAIVSDYKGTTTDPVYKAMELLPLGPVMIIDTPGIDDEGDLGKLRVQKAYQVLNKTDIALIVIDAETGISSEDHRLIEHIKTKNIPYLIVFNKCDVIEDTQQKKLINNLSYPYLFVSSLANKNITELKNKLTTLIPETNTKELVGDLISAGDVIVLVTPIDSAAPKGRLILPQQQVLRNILDNNAITVVVQEDQLAAAMQKMAQPPKLVITDSQAFEHVAKILPASVPLTSFSILFARYKGSLAIAVSGVKALNEIRDNDKILISEGCTHHRQCNDIGTVKLPNWIRNYTKANPQFEFTSGTEFPLDLSPYKMIVHCGACMLNEREVLYRYKCAADQNISITNYGILIAYMNGILQRSIAPLPDIADLL